MILNKARFYNITYNLTFDVHERFNIGTYKEKTLHLALKRYFEESDDYHEVPTNGFIADVRRDNEITEIETLGFSGLVPKLSAYLPEYKVNLVHPLAAKKYVSWIDPGTREISQRRISPKKETVYDGLYELVRILPHIKNENLNVVFLLLEMDEYKLLDGWSRDKKRGAHRFERIPTDVFELIEINSDEDYIKYIPDSCVRDFTVKDFARGAKIDTGVARAVVKVMEARGVIEKIGKSGRSFIYSRAGI
ncbi:MAG: hypothetical protein E7628_01880 [Ruminococcaceae bacterium]|nr:hypothetical protein [Oscillospiraceae bacterium]